LYAIQRTAGEQCAWFQDLRFAVPGRETVPFRYGMCRAGPSAPWQRFEMVGEGLMSANQKDILLQNKFTEILEEEHESESNIEYKNT
jgi:hypothetical protein